MGSSFRLEGHSLRLQSLRGIAALCVAIGHSFTVMINGRIEDAHFTLRAGNAFLAFGEILIQPNTAVILFYVLSGFVLGEALRRQTGDTRLRHVMAFSVRRLWRLLPVMWLSIFLAAGVAIVVRHAPFSGTTGWFNQFLSVTISPAILLQNFLALSYSINSVLWSIQIEIAMIALLPVLVWISKRTSIVTDLAIIAGLYVASLLFWNTAPLFVLFAYCFYVGVVLPKFLSNAIAKPYLSSGLGLLVALAILVPVEYLYVSNRLWLPYKFLIDTLVSGFVIGFVLLRPECKRAQFLDHPNLVWLGDISYSFYCYAMPLLILVAWALLMIAPQSFAVSDLGATATVLICCILVIAFSLILAHISFVRVETPCIAIGRLWSQRIEFGDAHAARSLPLVPQPQHPAPQRDRS
jgi:peptidoglycan/LPS O-acetylase OafA/YrhL